MMFIVAVIMHFREPQLDVLSQPVEVSKMMISLFNSYVVTLALCSIQFWLGLTFRNFIIPIAVGIALWFLGSILVVQMKSPLSNYFPYSYHMFETFPEFKMADTVRFASVGYALLFLAVGFFSFSRKEK